MSRGIDGMDLFRGIVGHGSKANGCKSDYSPVLFSRPLRIGVVLDIAY
jgi:PII-like signaling protein